VSDPAISFPLFESVEDTSGVFHPGYHDGVAWRPLDSPGHAPVKGSATAAQTLAATANIDTYASLPSPLVYTLTLTGGPWLCLFSLAAFANIAVNNVELSLALDISGSVTVPAGSHPEDRLHVLAKSPVAATLSRADYAPVNAGATVFELKYAATGAATVSDVAFSVIPLGFLPS
jgi:hypothetical protein